MSSAMTYDEFKAYYTRKHWRVGDADWEQDLDTLISKAEGKISRDLNHMDIWQLGVGSATGDFILLSPDVREIMHVRVDGAPYSEAKALSFAEWDGRYSSPNSLSIKASERGRYYSVFDFQLNIITGGTPSEPVTVLYQYVMGIKPYKDYVPGPVDDTIEPFYGKHQEFYEAAVDVQAYEYLKDYERSNEYNGKYQTLLEDMRRDGTYRKFGSGRLNGLPPGRVA